jgi:hypothetical protein
VLLFIGPLSDDRKSLLPKNTKKKKGVTDISENNADASQSIIEVKMAFKKFIFCKDIAQ